MLTENERLRQKIHTHNNILKDIKEELRWYDEGEEITYEVEKIIDFNKNPESWIVC